MKKLSKIVQVTFFAAAFAVLFSGTADAYIDPSVMNYAIQAVAGVVIAVGAAAGIYWRKAKKKIDTVPINIWMRDVIGDRLDPAKTEETESKVRNLLEQKDAYHDKIEKIVEEYVYNLGNSAEVGAKYIVQAVQEQIKKAKEQ